MHMRFRTTLGNDLIAIGQGKSLFKLQLSGGRLNLVSNLISNFHGIFLGENLNNTHWQKVYVAVNSSHLTLGVNDRLQATQPINPTGLNDTIFVNTYLGGIEPAQAILAHPKVNSFTGCIQDIVVNDARISEEDFKEGAAAGVEQVATVPGCLREEQCDPNPCGNEGSCTDLWSEYRCTCHRPFLGPSCQYNYTGATFGYENITTSIAVVDIDNPAPFSSGVDISFFIRTREQRGFIFYLGTDVDALAPTSPARSRSYITGQLNQGNLVVNVFFDGKMERFQVYTVDLSDGYRHFLRVVRMNNSMMVKVNETVSINHEIPSPTSFLAEKLYLGNYPVAGIVPASTTSTTTTTTTTSTTTQPPAETSASTAASLFDAATAAAPTAAAPADDARPPPTPAPVQAAPPSPSGRSNPAFAASPSSSSPSSLVPLLSSSLPTPTPNDNELDSFPSSSDRSEPLAGGGGGGRAEGGTNFAPREEAEVGVPPSTTNGASSTPGASPLHTQEQATREIR